MATVFGVGLRRLVAPMALVVILLSTPGLALASGVKATNTPELVRQGSELYLEARYQEAQDVLR